MQLLAARTGSEANIRIAESTSEYGQHGDSLGGNRCHLQKLVDLQSKSTKTDDPKTSAKLPPPPIAPAGMNVTPQVAPCRDDGAASDVGNGSSSGPAEVDATFLDPSGTVRISSESRVSSTDLFSWDLWDTTDANRARRIKCSGRKGQAGRWIMELG